LRAVATITIFLVFLAAAPFSAARAQRASDIVVERIAPRLADGQIVLSAQFRNLFSKRIVGTIQSGLPSIIQIEIKLSDSANRSLVRKRISRKLSYDIWEEKYTLTNPDTSLTFKDFEAVKSGSSRIDSLTLLKREALRDGQAYRVQMRVGIVPITQRQAEKVTDWLRDPNQTDEYVPSDERSSGFQLNLNKLVSFFVSSHKPSGFESRWFSSKSFTLQDLQP